MSPVRTGGGDSHRRRKQPPHYLKYYFVAIGTFLVAFISIVTSQLQLHKINIKSSSPVKTTTTTTENDVLSVNNDRYFAYKPSTTTTGDGEDVNRGNEYYIKHLVSLVQRSWDHYERRRGGGYLDYYFNLLWTRSTLPKIVNNAEQTLYVG